MANRNNSFAQAARARKVRALVIYLDVEFARRDIDPIRQAGRVANDLRKRTEEDWKLIAILAGQKPPSDESVTDIIAVYEARVIQAQAPKRSGGFN